MSDLEARIKTSLEPILKLADPRERISAYHDMPYALFRYEPEEEFDLRKQITLLETRLTQKGKRMSRISLARCLDEAMRSQRPLEDWFAAEREQGTDTIVETVHSVLSEYAPLVDLVAAQMPTDPDPLRDIVLILRTGALFPVYRTFSLLEQLKGRVIVPTVLFYPGDLDGAAGLRFMGVLAAEHNYRPKISEPKQKGFARWHGDGAARRAVTNNRTRLLSGVAKEAFKLRAEIVERSFAHNLDRGGMRRTWLRGRENVHKRYLLHVAGHNLSLLMRKLIGAGTPREAVAGGYGCICVLIAPAGAVLVAQMVLIVSEDGETAFVALCFAVE